MTDFINSLEIENNLFSGLEYTETEKKQAYLFLEKLKKSKGNRDLISFIGKALENSILNKQ